MTEEELDTQARDQAFISMRNVLDSAGVTPDRLVTKLKEELDATVTKTFQHRGVIIDSEEKIDWGTRQKARQDAHKLRGDYPSERHQVEGEIKIEVINFSSKKEQAISQAPQTLDDQGVEIEGD